MKKIKISFLCIVLAISILFSYPVMAFDNKFITEIEDLKLLGILPCDASWDAIVTRGEFAKYITSLTGYVYGAPSQTDVVFTDVPVDNPYYDYVTYCAKSGYMAGFSDKTFKPYEPILTDHALKVLVSVLGYDYLALSQGGYLQGYILTAKNLNLLKGINLPSGENILLCETAKLLSNALSVPVARVTGVGDDLNYTIDEKVTLSSLYFDIYSDKGVMVATDIAAINGYMKADEDSIVINGTKFYVNGINPYDYLGCHVNFVYKTNKDKERNEIIKISLSDKNETLIIDREDIISIQMGQISYADENLNTKTVKLSQTFEFIYNGENKNFDISYIQNSLYGQLKLIATEGGVYDLMLYENFETVVVERIDDEEFAVFDKATGKKYSFDFKKIRSLILDSNGKEVAFETIKISDVLTISNSSSFIKARVSDLKEFINVSSVSVSDGIIYGDNKEYKFAKDKKSLISLVEYNTLVTLHIDALGNVADIEFSKDRSEKRWAYLIKSNDVTVSEDVTIYVKAYTDRKTIETFVLNTSPVINGSKKKNITYSDFKSLVLPGNVFAFELNTDGELSKIETARPSYGNNTYGEYEDGLSIILSGNYEYNSSAVTKSFGTRAYIGNNTFVVKVPETKNLEKSTELDFSEVDLVGDYKYDITAYGFSKDDKYADVITVTADNSDSYNARLVIGVVTRIVKAVDEDGQERTKVYYMMSNEEGFGYINDGEIVAMDSTVALHSDDTSAYGTMKLKDIKPGDVIALSKDNSDTIIKFKFYYTPSANYVHSKEQSEDQDYRVVKVPVKKIDSEFITFDIYTRYYSSSWSESEYPEYIRYKNANVTVVRKAGDNYVATPGTINDVKAGDELIVQIQSKALKTIFIYK